MTDQKTDRQDVDGRDLIRSLLYYADGHELRGQYANELKLLKERANKFLDTSKPASDGAEGAEPNEIHSSDGGVGSQTRKELSADAQSLMAAGNVDSLGVAPGPSDFSSAPPKPAPDAMRDTIRKAMNHLSRSGFTLRDNEAFEYLTNAVATTAALSAPVPPADGVPDNVLPCDVHLPPNTFLRKGCQFDAFMTALRARYSFPSESKVFVSPSPAVAAEWTPFRFVQVAFAQFKEPELRKIVEAISKQFATPPVRGDREAIARAIFKNRQHLSDQDVDKWFKVYAENPEGIDHFRMAIWRAYSDADAILSLPVQSGAGERE